MSALRVLVGLGNPGPEHTGQRHNAGFWLVDALVQAHAGSLRSDRKLHGECARVSVGDQELLLLKPDTFMNRSGRCVQAAAAYFKVPVTDILIAHDELDLPPGTVRLKRGGGNGGHNGLRDITSHLGADFARIRLGIGHPGHKSQVLNYVLGRPSSTEEAQIRDGIAEVVSALPLILDHWDKAAQKLHTAGAPAADNGNKPVRTSTKEAGNSES